MHKLCHICFTPLHNRKLKPQKEKNEQIKYENKKIQTNLCCFVNLYYWFSLVIIPIFFHLLLLFLFTRWFLCVFSSCSSNLFFWWLCYFYLCLFKSFGDIHSITLPRPRHETQYFRCVSNKAFMYKRITAIIFHWDFLYFIHYTDIFFYCLMALCICFRNFCFYFILSSFLSFYFYFLLLFYSKPLPLLQISLIWDYSIVYTLNTNQHYYNGIHGFTDYILSFC